LKKKRGNLRIIITRPSLVSCCYKEPFAGWIDTLSAFGTTAFPMTLALQTNHYLGLKDNPTLCGVPADVVSNGILVATVYAARTPEPEFNVIH
jgi:hypothetical protein